MKKGLGKRFGWSISTELQANEDVKNRVGTFGIDPYKDDNEISKGSLGTSIKIKPNGTNRRTSKRRG
jgi:hypothetical protein